VIVGLSTRAFAESASRAGYACVGIDAFGDLDQKARVENIGLVRDLGRAYTPAAAVAHARRQAADASAYVSNLENHPRAVRRLAEGRTLLGNSPETLEKARDVAALAAAVAEGGARMPRTVEPQEAARLTAGAWLRKPRRGGGGSGIRRWKPGDTLGPFEIVQEEVQGVSGSVAFVADGARALCLGFSQGLAGDAAFGAAGFRYCGNLHPLSIPRSVAERLDVVVQEVTRTFALKGLNGVDFIVRDGEVYILELNPRYSASMELIERRLGLSLFEVHVAGCRGELPRLPRPRDGAPTLGKAVLWAPRPLRMGDTRAWLSSDDVRDVPFPGETIPKGHPVCTVFARGATPDGCYRGLVAAAGRFLGAGEP
jgi:predicted ATP-grasp superfamily ATP-dependent carboligase